MEILQVPAILGSATGSVAVFWACPAEGDDDQLNEVREIIKWVEASLQVPVWQFVTETHEPWDYDAQDDSLRPAQHSPWYVLKLEVLCVTDVDAAMFKTMYSGQITVAK